MPILDAMSESPHQMSSLSGTPTVPIPVPKEVDPEWQEKIDRAKQAREFVARLREGKPKSFRRAIGKPI